LRKINHKILKSITRSDIQIEKIRPHGLKIGAVMLFLQKSGKIELEEYSDKLDQKFSDISDE
jgi:hypothetical protein